ncbi:hypothetical protein C8R45DRAFT_1151220 [Mycena sanguinolenta]|nr:hypothetical protein C8R45DRAFT_1151220 [Mycena sanguinolenta]
MASSSATVSTTPESADPHSGPTSTKSASIPPIRLTLPASLRAPLDAGSMSTTTVAPLPAIQAPARQNALESVALLPAVRIGRALSLDGEEDENNEMETVDGAPIEETESVQNPARAEQGSNHVPLLTASTDRSMVDQTIRSFESRPGSSNRAKATVGSSSTLARTASSSSVVVTFDDVTPSDLEIYQQAGLLPTTKGEKVPAHRARTDENELRIATHMVSILRRFEQMEKRNSAQFTELLMRIEDNARNSGSHPSITSPAISADIDWLKDMVMEGRAAITSLTLAVKGLVDLPCDVSHLSCSVQSLSLARTEKTATEKIFGLSTNVTANRDTAPKSIAPLQSAVTTAPQGGVERFPSFDVPGSAYQEPIGSAKRSGTFAGFEGAVGNKKGRTNGEEPTHVDVYLWKINPDAAAPMAIAQYSLRELDMTEYLPNVISVACPRNTENLISIRFRALAIADLFVERLRSNPPDSMKGLNAAKRDSYEKKGKGREKGKGGPCLRIIAWNIHGRLAVKITEPDIVRLIKDNDVTIFQETFLRIGEERTLDLPPGFEIVAMSRPDLLGLRAAGGGVAAVIRTGIPYLLLSHLCAPDLIVLDLHHLSLVGAYILPEGSNWRDWTDVDPKIKVSEAITVLAALPDKPMMFHGDTNSRMGHRIPSGALLVRASSDTVVNSRGRWLLRLCSDTSLTILNGTVKESSVRGAFTSFQPLGSSVIDYCFVSEGLIPRMADGSLRIVKSPIWSDHAQVHTVVIGPGEETEPPAPPKTVPIVFEEPTALDILLEATIAAAVGLEEATARLYGPVYERSSLLATYIATSSRQKRAAFAVWRGVGAKANKAFLVHGEASDGMAAILAVLCAVCECPTGRSLVIYTSSQYVIRSFCYWAGENETRGWSCANGDALRDTVEWIAHRRVLIEFRWVKSTDDNPVMKGARDHTKGALHAETQLFQYSEPPRTAQSLEPPLESVRKVTTQLEEFPEAKEGAKLPKIDVEEVIDPDIPHRGRKRSVCFADLKTSIVTNKNRERVLMRQNLMRLVACNGKSSKPFWDVIRGWTDNKPFRLRVTPAQLHESFKARLNPPHTLPDCFDADLDDIVRSLNASIPRVTTDRTSEKFFTRRITIKDIQEIKRKLQRKSFRSAVGIDEISYTKIITIPNDALVTLFHACLDDLDAPQKWLVTLLVGILKEGRAVDDPESYRLVGLECCLLKVLTLLLDGRLREWAAANNVIPDSQNGFQPGHRTDDNSFILLCTVHWARAEGKTLYVFFGDMTNAFPYTDVGRLWSDICGGLKFGDKNCLPFHSMIGLFTGDSASPSLWNIYFADFRLPPHKDDVHLNGRPVSQAEQADNNLIMSTSFPAVISVSSRRPEGSEEPEDRR